MLIKKILTLFNQLPYNGSPTFNQLPKKLPLPHEYTHTARLFICNAYFLMR